MIVELESFVKLFRASQKMIQIKRRTLQFVSSDGRISKTCSSRNAILRMDIKHRTDLSTHSIARKYLWYVCEATHCSCRAHDLICPHGTHMNISNDFQCLKRFHRRSRSTMLRIEGCNKTVDSYSHFNETHRSPPFQGHGSLAFDHIHELRNRWPQWVGTIVLVSALQSAVGFVGLLSAFSPLCVSTMVNHARAQTCGRQLLTGRGFMCNLRNPSLAEVSVPEAREQGCQIVFLH